MIDSMAKGFIFLLLFFSVSANAQNIANCDEDISAKAMKLYQKGIDKKKNGKEDRLKYLKEALDEEPDFIAANFALAIERIKTAKYEGSGYNNALTNLEVIADKCPNYHSDVYYYLGAIYMGNQEYIKAAKYQEAFLKFTNNDEKAFSKDYEKKYDEIKVDFEFADFFAKAYSQPVPFSPLLVENINTSNDEYLPLISPDNEYIFFTRKSEVKSKVQTTIYSKDSKDYMEEFMRSKIVDQQFQSAQAMPPPFNMEKNGNYGGATISVDNREMILTVCRPTVRNNRPYNDCDLYVSRWILGYDKKTETTHWHWTELENLGENVNSDGWESQPSLSGDGQTLFFASYRENSEGIDIYFSKRNADGSWQKAQNIGPPINTKFNDKSPFIHSDSKTLYFSSQGHIGFGGYDIFMAKQNIDGSWSKPINIGYPINSENDEHGLIVATNGKDVFFASDQMDDKSAGLNIYNFELYKEARPEKVAFVKGNVSNEEGKPLNDATVKLTNMTTKEIQSVKVDAGDGYFAAVIAASDDDELTIDVSTEEKTFNTKLVPKAQEQVNFAKVDVEVRTIKPNTAFTIEDIYYETNSAEIKPQSKIILQSFANFLKQNPELNIEIRGHTDNIGSDANNLALSTDRAFSVMDYLLSEGVDKKRLSFKGFGAKMPIADNETESGRAKNRRTEFFVFD